MTFFEVGMLMCFGAAWPLSIYKSWKSKTTKGKSLMFLLIVLLGYLFGIIHKLINDNNYVLYFYLINMIMVLFDVLLYIRNYKYDLSSSKHYRSMN